MRRSLRYTDAVKMLGGGDSKLIAFLDAASSGVLVGVEALDLFEAKSEAVRIANKTLKGIKGRLSGLNTLTRTERLAAAHWIVIITAFFEAAEEHLKAIGIKDLGASAGEQVVLMTETYSLDDSFVGLARSLAWHNTVPNVEEIFLTRSQRFVHHLGGLAVFEALSTAQREQVGRLIDVLPATAVLRYEERLRDLAEESVEFGIWLNQSAHARTLQEVREVRKGLMQLGSLLTESPLASAPHDVRGALSTAYRAALDKPITQRAAADLDVPTLREGYVDHRFRVAEWHPSANPSQESWWQECPVHDELDLYLASYLVSLPAQHSPMLVLGQPGSGKSVLTRMLAARLPTDRFLPIRVELRSIDANADLQSQIEEAVRQTTGESVRWPDLVRSAPEAMPVILLDGFDELLQATGVAQTDFLENVRKFQERETDQGRAVAVLVTSRIAVADRARIPVETRVLCLEPFDERQVKAWLDIWAERNEPILKRRGLAPLNADTAMRHRVLAEQPLMLLMLALYDASSNALGSADRDFGQAALYEALLTDFARREVEKDQPGPAEDEAVERELTRLSVVSFAMFNRRAQWTTDEDVTADLTGLRMAGTVGGERRMRKALTPGQLAVGRFFFIHDTRATRDGSVSQTYEFLHATFGEYLIARLTARLVAQAAEARRRASAAWPTTVDDALLHALLSFECLAARVPIVEFLTSLIPPDPDAADLLVELFAESLDQRSDTVYAGYRPTPITVVQRHANWSANLMLLAAIAADGITASRLFSESESPAAEWRNTALLWRGQLTSEGRNGLIRLVAVRRTKHENVRDLHLSVGLPAEWISALPPDLAWTYEIDDDERVLHSSHDTAWMLRKTNFTATKAEDLLMHGSDPILAVMPRIANIVIKRPGHPAITPAHAISAMVASLSGADMNPDAAADLVAVYRELLNSEFSLGEFSRFSTMAFGTLFAATLAGIVPKETYNAIVDLPVLAWDRAPKSQPQALGKFFARAVNDHIMAKEQPSAPTTPAPPASAASPTPSPSPTESSPESPATPPAAP